MAKRFTKPSINWAELEKRVPKEQRNNFLAFKSKADVYLRKVQANPPELPKINWDNYKKLVPAPEFVDKFKTAYEQLKVPYPDDKISTKIDEQWKALEPEIKAFCAERQIEIDAATKEVTRIKALPKFDDMTMETFYDLYPNEALDPVKRPSFWPHNPEEQPGYKMPQQKTSKTEGKQ